MLYSYYNHCKVTINVVKLLKSLQTYYNNCGTAIIIAEVLQPLWGRYYWYIVTRVTITNLDSLNDWLADWIIDRSHEVASLQPGHSHTTSTTRSVTKVRCLYWLSCHVLRVRQFRPQRELTLYSVMCCGCFGVTLLIQLQPAKCVHHKLLDVRSDLSSISTSCVGAFPASRSARPLPYTPTSMWGLQTDSANRMPYSLGRVPLSDLRGMFWESVAMATRCVCCITRQTNAAVTASISNCRLWRPLHPPFSSAVFPPKWKALVSTMFPSNSDTGKTDLALRLRVAPSDLMGPDCQWHNKPRRTMT